MGNVNFNTNVRKNVDISKDVDINVDKDVRTNVDLRGSLASAEASADAVGGGGGGGGSTTALDFLLDDFSDLQTTVVNSGTLQNTGTAPGVDFPPPIFDPGTPDGETFDGTEISPNALRTFELFLLEPPGPGQAALTSGQVGDRGTFSNDNETNSNQRVIWTGGPFEAALADADLTDPANAFIVEDVLFDPGIGEEGGPATFRVELQFEDAQGDLATDSVIFSELIGAPLDLVFPLGVFTGDLPDPPPGTELFAGTGVLQGPVNINNAALDFDQLVRVEMRLLDDPLSGGPFGSFVPGAGVLAVENLSTGGTDLSADDIRFVSEEEDGDVFNIAETETFAQVTEDGAFSFSDALAATNAGASDNLL
jgi:hypothetical protein